MTKRTYLQMGELSPLEQLTMLAAFAMCVWCTFIAVQG